MDSMKSIYLKDSVKLTALDHFNTMFRLVSEYMPSIRLRSVTTYDRFISVLRTKFVISLCQSISNP